MLFWWLVAGLLAGEFLLLSILLLPLPAFLINAIVLLLDRINKPLYVVLAVMCWVLFDSTMEMQKYAIKPPETTLNPASTEQLFHKNKWRSERNFYMVAFTWTLLVILLRCHALARRTLNLQNERDELLALRKANQDPKATPAKPETKKSQ
eukprot:TRINITY_DN1341_c0_g1_i1.p1 TRINITY_DN1341_c0_g1~~TRINITY_DN1341_c0_g1_i1.p1  ORF type:complete len:151 (+),score=28.86 TRINITY_DN1341_c0_g1_i1:99-551(+)